MKYVIVYWSRYGNNKKIADYLAGKLGESAQLIKAEKSMELPDAETYIFSAASEKFSINSEMKKVMKAIQGKDGKKYGIINTHCMKKSFLHKMDKLLKKSGMTKAAEVDFLMGKEVNDGKGLQDGWEQKLDAFVARL